MNIRDLAEKLAPDQRPDWLQPVEKVDGNIDLHLPSNSYERPALAGRREGHSRQPVRVGHLQGLHRLHFINRKTGKLLGYPDSPVRDALGSLVRGH